MRVAALFGLALAACAGCGSTKTAPSPVRPSLDAVVDLGASGGSHHFRLLGAFQDFGGACAGGYWAHRDAYCNTIEATCNGALVLGSVVRDSATELLVDIPERPSSSNCAFVVKAHPASAPEIDSQAVSLRPIAAPPIEILAVADMGLSGPFHTFELSGVFPDALGEYAVRVTCNGVEMPGGVTGRRPGAVDVRFLEGGVSESCGFQVLRPRDSVSTPIWYQRVNGAALPLDPRLGSHYRGGFQPGALERGDVIRQAVRRVRDAGLVGPVRFVIAPQQRGSPTKSPYDIDFSLCPPSVPLLPCVAGLDLFQNAFDELGPNAPPVVITTFDGASGGPNGTNPACLRTDGHCFLDEVWMAANGDAVRAEYAALATTLYRTQAGKGGRHFILSNWEGDNLVYCGSAYGYARGQQPCPLHAGDPDIQSRFAAFTAWFRARQAGILDARAQFGAQVPDVLIDDCIEFNSYGALADAGFPSVLRDIVPAVRPAYASYSAWESLHAGRFEEELDAIAAVLAPLGTTGIVGEFGQSGIDGPEYPPDAMSASYVWRFGEVVRAALRTPFPLLLTWEPYGGADLTDALLTTDGVELPPMGALREAVQPAGMTPSKTLSIVTVAEIAPVNGRRVFTLEGSFATGAALVARARCDDDTPLDARLEHQGRDQLVVSIPDPDSTLERWCVFAVEAGGESSDSFGPIRSCPASASPWAPCPKYP